MASSVGHSAAASAGGHVGLRREIRLVETQEVLHRIVFLHVVAYGGFTEVPAPRHRGESNAVVIAEIRGGTLRGLPPRIYPVYAGKHLVDRGVGKFLGFLVPADTAFGTFCLSERRCRRRHKAAGQSGLGFHANRFHAKGNVVSDRFVKSGPAAPGGDPCHKFFPHQHAP